MIEETTQTSTPAPKIKKKGGWFQKVPRDILLTPGGIILIFLSLLIEIIDLIPLPFFDQILEIPLEIIYYLFFIMIVKPDFKSLVIPFMLERIPGLGDILPTTLLKLFGLF